MYGRLRAWLQLTVSGIKLLWSLLFLFFLLHYLSPHSSIIAWRDCGPLFLHSVTENKDNILTKLLCSSILTVGFSLLVSLLSMTASNAMGTYKIELQRELAATHWLCAQTQIRVRKGYRGQRYDLAILEIYDMAILSITWNSITFILW